MALRMSPYDTFFIVSLKLSVGLVELPFKIVATTHRSDSKAIITGGTVINSKRALIFLLATDAVGQNGNANMAIC